MPSDKKLRTVQEVRREVINAAFNAGPGEIGLKVEPILREWAQTIFELVHDAAAGRSKITLSKLRRDLGLTDAE